jgi:hypothetical protein
MSCDSMGPRRLQSSNAEPIRNVGDKRTVHQPSPMDILRAHPTPDFARPEKF